MDAGSILTCRDVAKLIAESYDRPLPWWVRLRIAFHLIVCRLRVSFQRDVSRLHTRVPEHVVSETASDLNAEIKLSAEARLRIKQAVESHLQ